MIKKITLLIVALLISGCAGHKSQAEIKETENPTSPAPTNEVLEFLIDIQERNFRKSVEFCQTRKPEMQSAFAEYLNQYQQGAQLALQQIGRRESVNMMPKSEEIEHFQAVQDKQGELTLERVISNPTYGCGKMFTIFSVYTAADAESQLLANYASYLEKRREYCSRVPAPEGCP